MSVPRWSRPRMYVIGWFQGHMEWALWWGGLSIAFQGERKIELVIQLHAGNIYVVSILNVHIKISKKYIKRDGFTYFPCPHSLDVKAAIAFCPNTLFQACILKWHFHVVMAGHCLQIKQEELHLTGNWKLAKATVCSAPFSAWYASPQNL